MRNYYTQRQWDRTVGYGTVLDEYNIEKKDKIVPYDEDRMLEEKRRQIAHRKCLLINYIPHEKRILDDCVTVEQVDDLIKSAEIDRDDRDIDTWDSLYSNNMYARELCRLHKLKKFLALGVTVRQYSHSGFLVEGKFVVGFQKNRWRVKGQEKWYWYKDEEDLVNRYIRKGQT